MEESGILVVDDDQDNLNLIELFFMCEGLKIHCAATGERALRLLEEREFAILLTDLNMPEMNGLELARRARERAPAMAVVMFTGQLTEEVARRAAEAGIVQVFPKPFNLQILLDMARCGKNRETTPRPQERPAPLLRELRPVVGLP